MLSLSLSLTFMHSMPTPQPHTRHTHRYIHMYVCVISYAYVCGMYIHTYHIIIHHPSSIIPCYPIPIASQQPRFIHILLLLIHTYPSPSSLFFFLHFYSTSNPDDATWRLAYRLIDIAGAGTDSIHLSIIIHHHPSSIIHTHHITHSHSSPSSSPRR